MTSVIKTHGLTKQYGNTLAVNDVSLTLNQGDIYGLIGRNGAGKSTLFKLLMGLTYPMSGNIEMFGNHLESELQTGRSNIGFMIEPCFFSYLNAYDNLHYFRTLKGIQDKGEVDRVLKLVELDGIKKPFKTFSMGMKQRLGIANALLGNPKVVILDEPVNGLDPQGIADFRHLVLRINKELGITFIVSSHILGELGLLATRFGFIEKGRLIEEIDQETLLAKSTTSIKLEVNDCAKTAVLLEEQLHIHDYRIISDKVLLVYQEVPDTSIVSKVLIDNGIHLKQIVIQKKNLEDYFFDLIGGTLHD